MEVSRIFPPDPDNQTAHTAARGRKHYRLDTQKGPSPPKREGPVGRKRPGRASPPPGPPGGRAHEFEGRALTRLGLHATALQAVDALFDPFDVALVPPPMLLVLAAWHDLDLQKLHLGLEAALGRIDGSIGQPADRNQDRKRHPCEGGDHRPGRLPLPIELLGEPANGSADILDRRLQPGDALVQLGIVRGGELLCVRRALLAVRLCRLAPSAKMSRRRVMPRSGALDAGPALRRLGQQDRPACVRIQSPRKVRRNRPTGPVSFDRSRSRMGTMIALAMCAASDGRSP